MSRKAKRPPGSGLFELRLPRTTNTRDKRVDCIAGGKRVDSSNRRGDGSNRMDSSNCPPLPHWLAREMLRWQVQPVAAITDFCSGPRLVAAPLRRSALPINVMNWRRLTASPRGSRLIIVLA